MVNTSKIEQTVESEMNAMRNYCNVDFIPEILID